MLTSTAIGINNMLRHRLCSEITDIYITVISEYLQIRHMVSCVSVWSSVWDKVIAGSAMILVYVAVAILLSLKRRILGLTSPEEVSQLLCKVSVC